MRGWLLLAVLVLALQAQGAYEALRSEHLSRPNLWINAYKNQKEYEALKEQQSELTRQIAQGRRLGRSVRPLEEELGLLEARLRLYETLPRGFVELIEEPLPQMERTELNLISFLSESPMRELTRAQERYAQMEVEYQAALGFLADYAQRVEVALESAGAEEKEALEKLLLRAREDLRYFELGYTLLEKRAEALERIGVMLDRKMRHYRDHDLVQLGFGLAVLAAVLLLVWIIKRFIHRFVQEEERALSWVKTVNLIAFVSIALFLIFHYIDNLLYALTFVGFVAAALTIVMKEGVLNLAGWLQLMFGSQIRVGDRILLYYETQPVIGDVVHISPMRMTLYEEITHNSAAETKRAGRIIFVPNNFLFTRPIFNYTHDHMKTIYDLIQVDLAYGSNFDKARTIAEEAVEHFTARHIEMARRQYERLRDRYGMRGKDLRPRIQFMTGGDAKGVSMYLWYVAPYREILGYRTDITLAVVDRFHKEPDIFLLGDESGLNSKDPSQTN